MLEEGNLLINILCWLLIFMVYLLPRDF
jgi:hypothetical protein